MHQVQNKQDEVVKEKVELYKMVKILLRVSTLNMSEYNTA